MAEGKRGPRELKAKPQSSWGSTPNGEELTLASLQRGLAVLWDRAASALAAGHDEIAGLALRRRQVLLHELDNLSHLIASQASNARVASRIAAAARLLEASLAEVSRTGQPQPREPIVLDLDPAVRADIRQLRAQIRNDLRRRRVEQSRKGERHG